MLKRPAGVRARGLGAELRTARDATGMSIRAVAAKLGCSPPTISRIETGKRPVATEEIAGMLALYGVVGPDRQRLLDAARDPSRSVWLETASEGLPRQATALIRFEAEATAIIDFETVLMPGLLQTAEYARSVMHGTQMPLRQVEALVATRIGRQAVLTRRQPPRYTALIDEGALRRPLGGPAVMAAQLRHVVTMARRKNVTVQVIPLASGGHPGLDRPYVLLEFATAARVVHLEHRSSGLFLDQSDDVAPYLATTATLTETALDPARSVEFCARLAAMYGKK